MGDPGPQPADAELAEAVRAGRLFELDGRATGDPAAARLPEQRVSAAAIRRLALDSDLDPHGIQLRGVRIVGPLDLENLRRPVRLWFDECFLDGGVVLRDASVGPIAFTRCRFRSSNSAGAFDAHGMQAPALDLTGCVFEVEGTGYSLDVSGAHIAGSLTLSGAAFAAARDGVSIVADGVAVDGGLFACVADGRRTRSAGAIRLLGATIAVRLNLRGTEISGADDDGVSLLADHLSVDGDALLSNDKNLLFTTAGAVHLAGAQVRGTLDLAGAHIKAGTDQVALCADGLVVDGNALFAPAADQPFQAAGSVRFAGARVTGLLNFEGAQITGEDLRGASIVADRLSVNGTCLMRATGSSRFCAVGQVRLAGAHITGVLDMSGAELRGSRDGISLLGERITIGGDLDLGTRDHDRGSTDFTSTATVTLRAASVGGRLKGRLATIGEGGGLALSLQHASLGEVCLDPDFGNRAAATVDLNGATYRGLPSGTAEQWIQLLRNHTPGFVPQPYQQLAAAFDGVGNKSDAVRLRIAQQDDRRDRYLSSGGSLVERLRRFLRRTGLGVQKVAIGYGFRTWPAFLGVVLFALLGCALGLAAGRMRASDDHQVAYRPSTATQVAADCSTLEQAALGIHIPFLTGLASGDCTLDTTVASGERIAAGIWTVDILVWASAALAVAGYTGLVRQS